MSEVVDTELLRSMPLPRHDAQADKDERGRVLVIGGSRMVPGALLLAGEAALRAGAGKLQLATIASLAPHVGVALPEALVLGLEETTSGEIAVGAAADLTGRLDRTDAVLIGPGMLDEAAAGALTAKLLRCSAGCAFVLDAGALSHFNENARSLRDCRAQVVLTPHAGEMAKLAGIRREDVEADPEAVASRMAEDLGVIVALKGGTTIIAAPDGGRWTYSDGKVGLATSGSGDTLAGVVAGLLARGAAAHEAAIWGVYLHGEAGNRLSRSRGPVGFLARELLAEIPAIMAVFSSH
jgi:hydroxyethylthiazole kinase-like uncharacterized protein yjeF